MLKFSFIIPAYNNDKLLINTLTALNMQKGYGINDYEVIVVDDGSPIRLIDSISFVPKNYQLQYVYIKRDKDSCRSAARNRGLAVARGKIIIFIDSDMIVNENYLSEVDRCFNSACEIGQDICLMSTRIYADREITPVEIEDKLVFNSFNYKAKNIQYFENRHVIFNKSSYNANLLIAPWLFTYSCNLAIQKKDIDLISGFDENFKGWGYEDLDFGYQLYKKGVKIVLNSRMEAIHQYHGEKSLFFSWAVDKSNQHISNGNYFFEKNKDIEGIIPYFHNRKSYNLLRKYKLNFLISLNLFGLKEAKGRKKYKIYFENSEELNIVKKQLEDLSKSNSDSIAYIYDYTENTDLDIWVQLMDSNKCLVKYWPKSRAGKNITMKAFFILFMLNSVALGIYLKIHAVFTALYNLCSKILPKSVES